MFPLATAAGRNILRQENVAKSFRNLERVSVLPSADAGVADIVGAAQLVLTQAALDEVTALARKKEGRAKGASEPALPEETS